VDYRGDKEYWQFVWDKFKAGDRQAFETIYKEFIDVLYAYGSKITSDKALLEDAIQDVFLDIYTYGKKLRHPEYLEFYLFKTLKRNIIRKLKEINRFDKSCETDEQFELLFTVEESGLEKQQLEERIYKLQKEIKNLDTRKRELLFLKFNSGLTYVEIGNLLNIKPDTVKKQVQRLLRYLQKNFQNKILEFFILCFKA
jgi:RNA polymerase sigma-70 factor (ECF subfamily)